MTAGVLVSGFGPFPGVPRNPSASLTQMLARTEQPPVGAVVLPVSWRQAWETLEPLLESTQPAHVILFGVASGAGGFRLERCAYNARAVQRDAFGHEPDTERIVAAGPDKLEASLPLDTIASALSTAGLPTETSCDPGRYLCNALYYHTLNWAQRHATQVGFVHIPPLGKNAPLNLATALNGARVIIKTARHAREAGRAIA